ncbi:MAG: hypothetical protein ACKERG_04735 [Candidatus Hodgkinia cicadicola]
MSANEKSFETTNYNKSDSIREYIRNWRISFMYSSNSFLEVITDLYGAVADVPTVKSSLLLAYLALISDEKASSVQPTNSSLRPDLNS